MEYPNSILIPPSTYDTTMDGLCENIPLRIHRNPELADRGAFRAQRDWKHAFGSIPEDYAGIMGPEHNFVSTCMPETLSDRLELIAYITEIVFLMDDMIDEAGSPAAVASRYTVEFLRAYNAVMAGGEVLGDSASPVVKILADIGRVMFEIDADGAKVAFAWLRNWSALVLSRPDGGKECRDLDEYLEYRRVNIASEYVHDDRPACHPRPPFPLPCACSRLTAPTGLRSDCTCSARDRGSPKTNNRHVSNSLAFSGCRPPLQMTAIPGSANTRQQPPRLTALWRTPSGC
jgi:hypothetical protein